MGINLNDGWEDRRSSYLINASETSCKVSFDSFPPLIFHPLAHISKLDEEGGRVVRAGAV